MFDQAVTQKSATCRNCYAKLGGAFCSACGQSANIHLDPKVKDILHDAFHEFTHVEGKIYQSVKMLFRKPGFLTKEFLAGKREKYVKPFRLYLTMSVIFFSLCAGLNRMPFNVTIGDPKAEKISVPPDNAVIDANKALQVFNSDQKYRDELDQGLRKTFPRMFLILVPVMALVMMLSYGRKRKSYAHYFYFSLHYHAVYFATLAVSVIVAYAIAGPKAQALSFETWPVSTVYTSIYFFLAVRRVWGDSTSAAIWRTLGVKLFMVLVMAGIIWADVFYYFWKLGGGMPSGNIKL